MRLESMKKSLENINEKDNSENEPESAVLNLNSRKSRVI
jgi:hypothetical protein